MKLLLILSLLFFTSCGQNHSQQTSNVLVHDTSTLATGLNSKAKQFECGTSVLLQSQLQESGMVTPDNFKQINFITTKSNFYTLLNRAKSDSLTISSFDLKRFREFYTPTAKDSIWLTMPFTEACKIQRDYGDSFPINISYSIDSEKRLKIALATDSTIANQLAGIIKN